LRAQSGIGALTEFENPRILYIETLGKMNGAANGIATPSGYLMQPRQSDDPE
jgi:hypothetical protein